VPGQSAINLSSAYSIERWDRNSPLRAESKQKGPKHHLTLRWFAIVRPNRNQPEKEKRQLDFFCEHARANETKRRTTGSDLEVLDLLLADLSVEPEPRASAGNVADEILTIFK
jgi:hypothetical protein